MGDRYGIQAIAAVTPGPHPNGPGVFHAYSAPEHPSFSATLSAFVDERVTAVKKRIGRGNRGVMTHNTPLSPRPLRHLSEVHRRVMTTAQLRSHGVTTAELAEQCRSGGPWQQLLPGVALLHPGPPTSEERLHAALMYAARESTQ